MSDFVHLHVHTEFSLLDGLCKIGKLVDRAVEYGMDSLAITDHGVMYGAQKFSVACQEAGIKPIIGAEMYQAARSLTDKEANVDADRDHLILLAKNKEGYQNLMRLVSLGHLEGFYYKPRIDWQALEKYHKGLIATSACLNGRVPRLLRQGEEKKAIEEANHFRDIFGDDFYLEIQHHPKIPDQDETNKKVIKLSRQQGIPLAATNDVHYIDEGDAEAQDALMCVGMQKMVADPNRLSMLDSPDLYLRRQEEMIELFKDVPDAVKNTTLIAEKTNFAIETGNWILPNYPLPKGKTAEQHFRELAQKGLETRYPNPKKEVVDRLNYELDIIVGKGFATYFLIVQDFVNWAKRQGIRVGPGRGSAAGSLVSYSLRITSVDPLIHDLPFERFMNPQRPTPPDIDLDFADNRRDEVIAYVTEKYGRDKVAQIITFGTMEARQAIRDIGRVLGMPYSEPDKIAKLIPMKMNLEEAIEKVPELEQFYAQAEYKKLIDRAKKVEGVSRHASVHAAGVVVADKPLTDYTPIQKESNGEKIVTQYDMYSLDLNVVDTAIGLLKIDFLGLRNLTILETARQYIKEQRDELIDVSGLPLDDVKTLKMIAGGNTTGVFQLESAGMRKLAKKLKPNRFSDISAMVALYRPGPMQFIDDFVAGKFNPNKIHYPHVDLKPILEETYGIIVYQEQVLQIANVMAGYSLGEADILRRAIGKKKKKIMDKEHKRFLKQSIERGYTEKTAANVWGFIEKFASYGFNKAHTVSYAMIAYQTAYFKAHFPVEFMAALLTVGSSATSGPAKDQRMTLSIEECKRLGIKVLPPNINTSESGFAIESNKDSLEGNAIRFGFTAIKNVGEAAINAILEARARGEFKSLSDFCHRADARKVNKKVIESLIQSGAMDVFGNRAAMLAGLDSIRSQGARVQRQQENGQDSLFQATSEKVDFSGPDKLPQVKDFSREERLAFEKELLGFYLTEHPLTPLLPLLDEYRSHRLIEIYEEEIVGKEVKIGGMIVDYRLVLTRKAAKEMAFVRIEDDSGSIEMVVFPKTYQETKEFLVKDKPIVVKARVEKREDSFSLIVEEVRPLKSNGQIKTIYGPLEEEKQVILPANTPSRILMALNSLFKDNPGQDWVTLVFVDSLGRRKVIKLSYPITYTESLRVKIRQLLNN